MQSHVTDLVSQLTFAVVRLECYAPSGRVSLGTGYYYHFCARDDQSALCIVTNKHVIRDAARAVFHVTLANEGGAPLVGRHESIEITDLPRWVINHPSPNIDLAAIPVMPLLRPGQLSGKKYFLIGLGRQNRADAALLAELSPMEDVIMLGYPSGLWDATHNMPIIRRGITATHPKTWLNGKPEFLIDAACFPGSSGSPVFLANRGAFSNPQGGISLGSRMAFLGTLYAGPQFNTEGEIVTVEVPTDTKSIAVGSIPMNLGLVIQGSQLDTLEEEVRKIYEVPARVPAPSRLSRCTCLSGKRFKDCCGKLA